MVTIVGDTWHGISQHTLRKIRKGLQNALVKIANCIFHIVNWICPNLTMKREQRHSVSGGDNWLGVSDHLYSAARPLPCLQYNTQN